MKGTWNSCPLNFLLGYLIVTATISAAQDTSRVGKGPAHANIVEIWIARARSEVPKTLLRYSNVAVQDKNKITHRENRVFYTENRFSVPRLELWSRVH